MTTIKQVALVAAGILCASLAPTGVIPAGAETVSNEAAYKAATDTDPHIPLTPRQQQMLALKEKAVADAFSGKASAATIQVDFSAVGITMTPALANAAASSSIPASDHVAKNQTPQKTSYWCGPASVHEALEQIGYEFSQATLAPELGTTTAGTAWSGGPTSTGHPVPDVMNKHQSYYYIPESVPSPPSDSDVSNYKTYLTYDIATVGVPIIGDAWEVPGGQFHLVGHPTNATIYHWFDIYGYRVSGGTTYTDYEDSVHGVSPSIISWAPNVPAYSELPSHQIAHIVGGRGYVW